MSLRVTGGELVGLVLRAAHIEYAAGVPGHGIVALLDGVHRTHPALHFLQTRHEQGAVFLADGYFRVKRQPLVVFTSIGPGALNTATGLATAFVDSSATVVITGDVHTHMRGRGILQELERHHDADNPNVLGHLTKRYWQVSRVDEIAETLSRGLHEAVTGRCGPVVVAIPMDLQAEATVADADAIARLVREPGRSALPGPAPSMLDEAAQLLLQAKRPRLQIGGGAAAARIGGELVQLAELLGAPVMATMNGKGAFPEDHPLSAFVAGSKGTRVGNVLAPTADLVLALGVRFADETTASYTDAIYPTGQALIHVDLDPREIGKNLPTTLGVVGDLRSAVSGLISRLAPHRAGFDYRSTAYYAEVQTLKTEWQRELARQWAIEPLTISRVLHELRHTIARNAIMVHSSGHAQAQMLQEFPFYEAGTNLTSGGFSTMGFALPAALGAKLAEPARQVVAVMGDGDFFMSMGELATAVQYNIAVTVVILNNRGWLSIRDLQIGEFGPDHALATEFRHPSAEPYSPNFVQVAQAFGAWARLTATAEEFQSALTDALTRTDGPSVIEVAVNREFPQSGREPVGWWDVPVPEYLTERRRAYLQNRRRER